MNQSNHQANSYSFLNHERNAIEKHPVPTTIGLPGKSSGIFFTK
jgi:hypothetical protein